jgi:CopG family transcriptional regulator, nickel-responsive regulator
MMAPDRVWEKKMQRLTITMDEDLVAEIDAFMTGRGYANRSEAIRDLAARGPRRQISKWHRARLPCDAELCLRTCGARTAEAALTQEFHDHHGIAQAKLHVRLDHDSCLEMMELKGKSSEVKASGDRLIAERGVRHGHITYVPADAGTHQHGHDDDRRYDHARGRSKKP